MQELVSDPLTLEATSKFEEVLVCVCARARARRMANKAAFAAAVTTAKSSQPYSLHPTPCKTEPLCDTLNPGPQPPKHRQRQEEQ